VASAASKDSTMLQNLSIVTPRTVIVKVRILNWAARPAVTQAGLAHATDSDFILGKGNEDVINSCIEGGSDYAIVSVADTASHYLYVTPDVASAAAATMTRIGGILHFTKSARPEDDEPFNYNFRGGTQNEKQVSDDGSSDDDPSIVAIRLTARRIGVAPASYPTRP
jgi:hypothetical protein